jgi:ferrochelatase
VTHFLPEAEFQHDRQTRIGVLLVNLGTPDAPTASAVRRFLAEFLTDRRVVEIPPFVWRPLLHGVVLRTRPGRSAKKYAMIWKSEGSPLLLHSQKQKILVTGYLGQKLKDRGLPADFAAVEIGMRYGNPAIAAGLAKLKAAGCDRILVAPLFPQYSAAATASALDATFWYATRLRRVPALRTIDCFHDDPGYIKALARNINDYWVRNGRPDVLLMSFHGLPRRSLDRGDPYHCHCQKTARLLAAELGLESKQHVLAFQSRFGAAEWLQPYTFDTLTRLAKEGVGRVDVVCPGFVSDCLETLEEIGIECKQRFLKAGGKEFHAIPCLNEHPAWIAALVELLMANLEGWLAPPPDPSARELTELRAKDAKTGSKR